MIRLALFMLLASVLTSTAQDLPAQYSVSGVAGDDVLNIRQGPGARTEKIGQLGPYTINVEVLSLSEDGRWGRIGMPEGNGWVAMRFLQRQALAEGTVIPRPLSCYGTEPFWRIGLFPMGDEFERMGEDRIDLALIEERLGENGYQADLSTAESARYSLVATRGACSDGMSDREFGWTGTLYIDTPTGAETLTGCCTLDLREGG